MGIISKNRPTTLWKVIDLYINEVIGLSFLNKSALFNIVFLCIFTKKSRAPPRTGGAKKGKGKFVAPHNL